MYSPQEQRLNISLEETYTHRQTRKGGGGGFYSLNINFPLLGRHRKQDYSQLGWAPLWIPGRQLVFINQHVTLGRTALLMAWTIVCLGVSSGQPLGKWPCERKRGVCVCVEFKPLSASEPQSSFLTMLVEMKRQAASGRAAKEELFLLSSFSVTPLEYTKAPPPYHFYMALLI